MGRVYTVDDIRNMPLAGAIINLGTLRRMLYYSSLSSLQVKVGRKFEDGGKHYGWPTVDLVSGKLITWVIYCAPSNGDASPVHKEIGPDTDLIPELLYGYQDPAFPGNCMKCSGIFHSHPGMKSDWMSGTDEKTHTKLHMSFMFQIIVECLKKPMEVSAFAWRDPVKRDKLVPLKLYVFTGDDWLKYFVSGMSKDVIREAERKRELLEAGGLYRK